LWPAIPDSRREIAPGANGRAIIVRDDRASRSRVLAMSIEVHAGIAMVNPNGRVTCSRRAALITTGGVIMARMAIGSEPQGTLESPLVDSLMSEADAFDGLSPECPDDIRESQSIVEVCHVAFDGLVHRGQVVVHRDLAADIRAVFDVALRMRFPIASVIPISHPRFRKDGRWNDDLSMEANNTSGFNYRAVTGGSRLSNHARGRAIDINPTLNPYVKEASVLPPGARYDPDAPGTFTPDHPVVRAFLQRGWEWGGMWTSLKDYQHFERPLPEEC
jgi:peptidoglycan L-alanyl-D-glutamate endopeptidase CwlK